MTRIQRWACLFLFLVGLFAGCETQRPATAPVTKASNDGGPGGGSAPPPPPPPPK